MTERPELQKPVIHPTTEARSLLVPQSLLAQVVETQLLPPERLKAQPNGEVVDIKKVGENIAALQKVDDHYEVSIYDGRGNVTQIPVDPEIHEVIRGKARYVQSKNTGRAESYGGFRISTVLQNEMRFSSPKAQQIEAAWYQIADAKFGMENLHRNHGMLEPNTVKASGQIILPAGEWTMGVSRIKFGEESYETFYFINESGKGYVIRLSPKVGKEDLGMTGPSILNPDLLDLSGSLRLKPENTLFRIEDKDGKELVSYSGTNPIIDPSDPNAVYFINTGQVYKLDLSGVENRASRPIPERQIKVENPQELDFEPNGNFLVVRSADGKLSVVDKESGDVVKTFDGVKGPVLVDPQGDIIYADSQNKLREIQTNFQAIPAGGSESARQKREAQLKELQERFANLELGKVQRQTGTQISEQDVANTLREAIARQVDEPLNTATTGEAVEDILDRLQGLKADPTNQAYQEVVDEFIGKARDKLSEIRTGEFDAQLNDYQKALEDVKSVGDTIGLDEQFAELLKLRQKIDVTDPQRRREIEQRMRTLQTQKDTLTTQYQGELLEAANQTLPQLEQLIKETGSPQELAYFSTSTQAQQFEMMLANIKDTQVRKDLRDRYQSIRVEQRGKLEEAGRQLEEESRQRWAQVVEEAREDLSSLQEQIAQLADTREIDRFGRNPLVTAWRAKLFALPPELRDNEEKRLGIILGARKKDMEHRKELGAVGEAGELKFGNATFPIYKDSPRLWQPKFIPVGGLGWADLVFEDSQGRTFRPDSENRVVVVPDFNDEKTARLVEKYRSQADEYFRGIKRKVPDFDEHWRITDFHMGKLEEVAEALNLQLTNHRGILILQGEAGTGKNVLADILANLSNREVIQIACNENTVKEDLTYEFYYDPQKGTYKLPSRLIEGLQTPGTIILWDEINALKPGIAKMMNSLFDYHRKIFLPEGGKQREVIADPTVLFVGTMNPQNYAGVNRLSPEVKSRARVVDIDYPPFEEMRGGRTHWRSDEAEMLAAYMDTVGELNQREFKQVWDFVINRDTASGGDRLIGGNPQLETDVRRIYDVIRVANRLRDMYEAYQVGDSNEPMEFPTSLREVTDIVMEMNHRQGVKPMIKRVIIPKIDDRRQKRLVEQTIDAVLP